MSRLPPARTTAAKATSPGCRLRPAKPHVPRPPWAPIQTKAKAAPSTSAAANRTGLPAGLKAGVEALSGLSMDDVRVHRNSPEPARLAALGFASGTDIHLAPGQERHLPHEAWHVVQQKQGRVGATAQLKGVGVNDSAALEAEADIMGVKAAAVGDACPGVEGLTASARPAVPIVQRMKVRGAGKGAQVSNVTRGKHVVAVNDQPQKAVNAFTSSTFVLAESDLITPIDADPFDFLQLANAVSPRRNINANVTIYQYNKRAPLPAGNGNGKPADLAINGVATNCEIGAVKDGNDAIKITHFMKV